MCGWPYDTCREVRGNAFLTVWCMREQQLIAHFVGQ
jgi:hypothetical protein